MRIVRRSYAETLYDSPEKEAIRQLIVNFAMFNSIDVKKIVTFPGPYAFCVQKFYENWPTAKIIGLEYDAHRATYGVPTRFIKDKNGNTIKKERFEIPTLEWKHTYFESWVNNTQERNFDLSYLDFKGFFDGVEDEDKYKGERAEQSINFINNFTSSHAIVAATFCPGNYKDRTHVFTENEKENELEEIINYFMTNCKKTIKILHSDIYSANKRKKGMFIVIAEIIN